MKSVMIILSLALSSHFANATCNYPCDVGLEPNSWFATCYVVQDAQVLRKGSSIRVSTQVKEVSFVFEDQLITAKFDADSDQPASFYCSDAPPPDYNWPPQGWN